MLSSADLFSLTLLATGGLYACMLAYFNGLVGSKRANTRIMWNSEPIIWILMLLLTFSVVFKIVEPGRGERPGLWYLIGAGNLLVIYIYLIIELARHDLPKIGYWGIAGLTTAVLIYGTADVLTALFTQTLDLAAYGDALASLLAAMTHLLLLILAFNLLRSLGSSLLSIWTSDPNSPDRLTAAGVAVSALGEVSNPEGALSDIGAPATDDSAAATLSPGSSIIVDFGLRRIEDHGFRSDLRVVSSSPDQAISIDVSNDKQNWEVCEREVKILTDWDVPYFDSPWRYVRITNDSEQALQIADVFDLD